MSAGQTTAGVDPGLAECDPATAAPTLPVTYRVFVGVRLHVSSSVPTSMQCLR